MFSRGILNGLKIIIPVGGQIRPNSSVGESLEWKNPQKKDKKKNTSEVINRIIPHFIPIRTFLVWNPWKVLSRDTSRHHWYIVNNTIIRPIINKLLILEWNNLTDPVNMIITLRAPVKGHGLLLTKWK